MGVVLTASRDGGGTLMLLGSRRFGPLFATQFLSAFNDNALKNALVLMVAYRAESADALSAGLLIPLAGEQYVFSPSLILWIMGQTRLICYLDGYIR